MALDIVFMGTPGFSVPVLEAIIGAGHRVSAVYSQPPRPAGRGMSEQKSAVHLAAEAHGIPVSTPKSLKGEAEQQAFASLEADVAVVVAYGLLLPKPVLAAPRHGCLNLHASALPRWRGAAPIQRAIMAGDRETAVMVMQMEEGLDTGPVCLAERVAIQPATTAGALHDELSAKGARLMVAALDLLEKGRLTATAQSADGATYAAKIGKSEAAIDFARPAAEVVAHIHGLSPFPGAWFEIEAGGKPERIKVLRAEAVAAAGSAGEVLDENLMIACATGAIRPFEVQRAGKKPMSAAELLRGLPVPRGTRVKQS